MNYMQHIANFEATQEPVDPKKLRVIGGRKISYGDNTYIVKGIDRSTRKDKKYVATVLDKNNNKLNKVHWGNSNYDDYYVHKDKNRRNNFKARHGAIKLKDGRLASEDPRQPSYYAMNANWGYMSKTSNWNYMGQISTFNDELSANDLVETESVSNDAPVVRRLGRFNNLKSNRESKIKRTLTTAQLLDLKQGEYE